MYLLRIKPCLISIIAFHDKKEEQYTFPLVDCSMAFNTASQWTFVVKLGWHGNAWRNNKMGGDIKEVSGSPIQPVASYKWHNFRIDIITMFLLMAQKILSVSSLYIHW